MTDDKPSTADVDDALDLLDDMEDGDVSLADDELRDDEDGEDGQDGEEDSEEDENEPGAKDGKPKGNRVQKRIDQLTREREDAKRERDYFRSRNEQTERRLQELEAWARQVAPTQDQYRQGQNQGYTRQEVQELVQRQAQEIVATERFQSTVDALQTRLSSEAPEAFARISNPALTMFENEAVEALAETANPTRIVKAIAGNEQLFARFASLPSGAKRAQFIARLDGQIEARRSAKPKPAAAEPTPKVRGASRAPEKDPEKMSQGEYEAWRKKQGWG